MDEPKKEKKMMTYSTVSSRKIDFLKTEIPDGPKAAVVPDWCPALPMTFLSCGIRGSGKTTFTSSMLRKMKAAGCMHRIFLLSPTHESNKHLWDGLIEDEDVFTDASVASLDKIIHQAEEEVSQFRKWKKGKEVFERFKKHEKDFIEGRVQTLDKEIVAAALHAGITELDKYVPYKTWGDIQRPLMCLVIDDCQNSPLFTSSTKNKNGLSSLCIRSRHIGGLEYGGLSLCLLLQNYKASQGVLSRSLRQNTTMMGLYGYRDRGLSKDIYEELASDMTEEEFYAAYDYATQGEKYNCLVIEFTPKLRLRRNFDEILTVGSAASEKSNEKQNEKKDNDDDDGRERKGGEGERDYHTARERVRLGFGATRLAADAVDKRAKIMVASNRKRLP